VARAAGATLDVAVPDEFAASLQTPADIGKAGVEQAIHALKGEPVQKKIGTGFVVVTKENMNNPDVQPFLYKSSC
jgi:ribose transport system substrate-binding protein